MYRNTLRCKYLLSNPSSLVLFIKYYDFFFDIFVACKYNLDLYDEVMEAYRENRTLNRLVNNSTNSSARGLSILHRYEAFYQNHYFSSATERSNQYSDIDSWDVYSNEELSYEPSDGRAVQILNSVCLSKHILRTLYNYHYFTVTFVLVVVIFVLCCCIRCILSSCSSGNPMRRSTSKIFVWMRGKNVDQ